jgi:hypothetical protein
VIVVVAAAAAMLGRVGREGDFTFGVGDPVVEALVFVVVDNAFD